MGTARRPPSFNRRPETVDHNREGERESDGSGGLSQVFQTKDPATFQSSGPIFLIKTSLSVLASYCKREVFSPCPQSVTPASYTPGLPKYKQNHKIIDINATDLWSLEAVTTWLRANPLPL